MEKVSGTKRGDAIDKMLVGELFCHHGIGYRVKDHDTLTKLKIVLNGVMAGEDDNKFIFGFFGINGKYVEALLSVNKRMNSEGKIAGTVCFLHVASPELQHSLQVQKMSEQVATNSLKELAYLHASLRIFTDSLLAFDIDDFMLFCFLLALDMYRHLLTFMTSEQLYGAGLSRVSSRGSTGCGHKPSNDSKQVVLLQDWSAEVSSMHLYGDNLRLQQILADFLSSALQFAPVSQGSILLQAVARKRKELTGDRNSAFSWYEVTWCQVVKLGPPASMSLVFRIIDPAPGIPEAVVQEMFHHRQGISRGGIGLYVSQKLVKIMNGTVQYVREAERSSFIILLEFPLVKSHSYCCCLGLKNLCRTLGARDQRTDSEPLSWPSDDVKTATCRRVIRKARASLT
ncbi:hypothetical protein C4D60_Mb04t39480 [Musa balbisiana]|uniref:histidine kinase n=1 Tax=Musa balbisiana TaxID=52838 RepID=A0A4S8KHZ1_MUSBA|nr:hypothetical protein C4D60_Mb04t39480 [Musa balbisiana]